MFGAISCDQAVLRTLPSARPSERLSFSPSVIPFSHCFLSSYHREIFRSSYHWQKWCPCKRSRSNVKGQGHTDQNNFYPSLAFPHRDSSLKMATNELEVAYKICALLLFEVIRQISRSHETKIDDFDLNWLFPDCNSSLNWNHAQSLK